MYIHVHASHIIAELFNICYVYMCLSVFLQGNAVLDHIWTSYDLGCTFLKVIVMRHGLPQKYIFNTGFHTRIYNYLEDVTFTAPRRF